MKNVSYKVAVGGVVAALCLVLMFLTGLFPFGTYAFPTFAGILIIAIVIEIGYPFAFATYLVVAILSFLIAADKEAALYFTMFLGFYPVLKSMIEKFKNKVVQYIIKFILFNACIIAAFYIGIFVLSIPKESFTIFGIYLPWVFLILGNLFFVLYDICITKLTYVYMIKIHPIISKRR